MHYRIKAAEWQQRRRRTSNFQLRHLLQPTDNEETSHPNPLRAPNGNSELAAQNLVLLVSTLIALLAQTDLL